MTVSNKINPDELFVQLLIGEKYRPLRHLALVVMLICIGIGNVNTDLYKTWTWFLTALVFVPVPILLNVYLFVPRLLLKNRPYHYVLALVIVVIMSITGANYFASGDSALPNGILQAEEPKIAWLLHSFSTLLMFALILTGTTSMIIMQMWLRDRMRISELEEASNIAELEMLKNQINPHFLFNMLNNSIVLVKENASQAHDVILKLRELLNYQFEMSSVDRIPLSGDIDFLDDLLHLEQIRRDRFDYRILVLGDTENIVVPPLLFIPFVENAIKHGNDNTRESYILIVFRIEKGKLDFFCTNSVPAHAAVSETGGLGLRNIRRRLELIYGDGHNLEINGTKVTHNVNLTIGL